MNTSILYSVDELLRYFGYKKCKIDPSGGANNNECKNVNLDMFHGFQDIDPMLLVVISQLFANEIAKNLPTSQLNAYGNWLQMIGQTMQVFIAQQQYEEAGPGRYYNTSYKNVANPFCLNPIIFENDLESGKNKKKKINKCNKNILLKVIDK
ncbi:MAG: hypothetical protein PUE01_04010 [Clostridiaceae bacterium]|nr:hypothetical protein [Clostridiaceae bacterium]